MRKRSSSLLKTKKKNKKRGGSSPPTKRRKTEKVWSELLPKEHQILCKKYNPKNLDKLAEKCYKYDDMDLWVHNSYGIQQVSDEASPLFIFNEDEINNFDDLKDGIHNFMLFWDEDSEKYTLATAYFNAFEFGSKHNIISYRTRGLTPDTFIISGEINKIGDSITFHDTSSQFFQDNLCNIKRQMPIIYLSALIDEFDIDIDTIDKPQLDMLKEKLFATNVYEEKFMRRINLTKTLDELVQAVSTNLPVDNIEQSVIRKNYVDLIQQVLSDAFEHLFKIKIPITYRSVFAFSDEEYGDQKSVKVFTQQMCALQNPIPFDVYFSDNDCRSERKKSRYDTCHLGDITDDYMTEMKKETPKKSSTEKKSTEKSVYVDGEKLSIDDIKRYWPNYLRFRDIEFKDTPELLYENLIKRIQKTKSNAVIEIR